jgi:hypothetical protein
MNHEIPFAVYAVAFVRAASGQTENGGKGFWD